MIKPLVFGLIVFLFISGCGVKGDPLPPLQPVEIGRGKPNFKRELKNVRLPDDQAPQEKENPDDEDETENEKEE